MADIENGSIRDATEGSQAGDGADASQTGDAAEAPRAGDPAPGPQPGEAAVPPESDFSPEPAAVPPVADSTNVDEPADWAASVPQVERPAEPAEPQSPKAEAEPIAGSVIEEGATPVAEEDAAAPVGGPVVESVAGEPAAEPAAAAATEVDENALAQAEAEPAAEEGAQEIAADVTTEGEAPPAEEGALGVAPAVESLDDIQPTAASPEVAEAAEPVAAVAVPWWPFITYLVLWVVLVGLAVWQFMQVPARQPIFETQIYRMTILGGLAMTAVGVLLTAVVWLATALRPNASHRGRLFVNAFFKGALVTFGGVVVWWIALIVVDYLRLGRSF